MPCPTKKSSRATIQRQSGLATFGPNITKDTDWDDGSLYSDSGSEKNSDDKDDTLKSIVAMQTLYSVFLPAHLRAQSVEEHQDKVSAILINVFLSCA